MGRAARIRHRRHGPAYRRGGGPPGTLLRDPVIEYEADYGEEEGQFIASEIRRLCRQHAAQSFDGRLGATVEVEIHADEWSDCHEQYRRVRILAQETE